MTSRQRIDATREARLWIGQIITPAVAIIASVPEARHAVARKARDIKTTVQNKIHQRKEF